MDSVEEHAERLRLSADLAGHARSIFSSLPSISLADFVSNIRSAYVRVCLLRQLEAIEATVLLAHDGLGHHGISYVRQAFDEHVWIEYLEALPQEDAQQLLLLLTGWEGFVTVMSQRDYLGLQSMIEMGFTESFLARVDSRKPELDQKLEILARKLSWPKNKKHHIPTTSWLAKETGLEEWYDYLWSTTSKSVHFSTSSIARRMWGSGDAVAIGPDNYVIYFTDFVLYWTMRLLWLGILQSSSRDSAIDSCLTEDMYECWTKLEALGSVPITHPAEYNLLKGQVNPLHWGRGD